MSTIIAPVLAACRLSPRVVLNAMSYDPLPDDADDVAARPSRSESMVVDVASYVRLVIGLTIFGLLLGLAIGTLLGLVAPDFLRGLFVDGGNLRPLQLGLGLGIVNGAIFGAGIATVLSLGLMLRDAIVAWAVAKSV